MKPRGRPKKTLAQLRETLAAINNRIEQLEEKSYSRLTGKQTRELLRLRGRRKKSESRIATGVWNDTEARLSTTGKRT